jgi:hypothetical protein
MYFGLPAFVCRVVCNVSRACWDTNLPYDELDQLPLMTGYRGRGMGRRLGEASQSVCETYIGKPLTSQSLVSMPF